MTVEDIITCRIFFDGEVTEKKARKTIAELYTASAENPRCDIEFVINSQGGCIWDGTAIYSELYSMSKGGGGEHHVTTKVRGMAGSIATLIFQAGDERVGGELDSLIFHESKLTFHGAYSSDVQRQLNMSDYYDEGYYRVIAERSGMTAAAVKTLCGPYDHVLLIPDAVKLGLADRVA